MVLETILASPADLATASKKAPLKDPVRPRGFALLWLLVPLTIYFAITSQSLWIDEGFSVWFASHDGFPSFLRSLVGLPGSPGDPQMLFYLSYLWGWIRIFGRSEEALRAANIPFFLIFIASLAWASRRLLQQPYLWAPFCLSPFVWFYLNEARPYAALIGFSTAALVSLLAYVVYPGEYRSWAPWCCLIAVLFACGSHILGAFLIPSMVALVVETVRTNPSLRHRFCRDWWRPSLSCFPAFAILAGFDAWASSYGINKSGPDPRFVDLVLVAGEFLGLRGVSPPRKQMQTGIPLDVYSSYWPLFLFSVAAIAAVTVMLSRTRPPEVVRALSVSLLAGIAVAFAFSWFADLHVSGRHMAVLFPLLPLIGMFWMGSSSSQLPRQSVAGVTVVLALAWSVSNARMLLLPQYKKDDYRGAASIALRTAESTGADILWAADPHVAHYYGIEVMKDHHLQEIGSNEGLTLPFRREATDARNWSFEYARRYFDAEQKPAVLVLSDSDLFDTKSGWEAFLRQGQPALLAKLNSFSIYQLDKGSSESASIHHILAPRLR